MATLRNKRKLAAVSRETPENTRNNQSQNTLDPEASQEDISQVFEEIEGRVTKKFSKEVSSTVSRILGALSKLELFLNPQVQTCSVAVPGTSRNSDSGSRELNRDRSPNNLCPEVRNCSHHSRNLKSSEVEKYPHMMTGGPEDIHNRPHRVTITHEKIPYCSLGASREKKRRRAPQVSHTFAVKTPLRQLKQTRFCRLFNNWRQAVIQPISTRTSTES